MNLERQAVAALIAALLGSGCVPAIPDGPVPPGLDPVERQALMMWTVSDPALSLGEAAFDLVDELRPSGIVAAGAASPSLVSGGENPAAVHVLAWTRETLAAGIPLSLVVETPLLPGAVTEACFDPSDASADPTVAAFGAELALLLDAWPEITGVMPDGTRTTPYWDVACTCTPCDSTDAAGMANRHRTLWSVAAEEVSLRQRELWWWHNAPDSAVEGAPEEAPNLPGQVLDLLLADDLDVQTPLRAPSGRGMPSPWAPVDPVLEESSLRRVAGSVDVSGSQYGPTDALLFFSLDVYAQLRSERARGVGAWFVQLDGGGRTAVGGLEELDLFVIERAFRDPTAVPSELLTGALEELYGLEEDEAYQFGRALQDTGHALALATHPMGIPIVGVDQGTPSSLPLTYDNPGAFDSAWTARFESLSNPGLDAIVQVNQWAKEAALTSSVAIGALNSVEDLLSPDEVVLLRRRIKTLDFAARAWGRLALADVTLRAFDGGFDDERLLSWLSEDIVTLDFLADEVETSLAAGTLVNAFPVIPANLRSVAQQLRVVVGSTLNVARDFPVLYRARHDFENGRVNYYWTVTPPGVGWVERGTTFPEYTEESDRGEESAAWWHAWNVSVPSDTKITWRPCTESPEGLAVCGSDRVLWTPL